VPLLRRNEERVVRAVVCLGLPSNRTKPNRRRSTESVRSRFRSRLVSAARIPSSQIGRARLHSQILDCCRSRSPCSDRLSANIGNSRASALVRSRQRAASFISNSSERKWLRRARYETFLRTLYAVRLITCRSMVLRWRGEATLGKGAIVALLHVMIFEKSAPSCFTWC